MQPRCLPPALISDNRIKCRSLGIFLVVVEGRWELKGSSGRKAEGREGAGRENRQLSGSRQARCLPGKRAELVLRLHCLWWELVEA